MDLIQIQLWGSHLISLSLSFLTYKIKELGLQNCESNANI